MSGLFKDTRNRIADLMTGWGYVSLVVDSFATRDIKQACDGGMPARQADALGALLYLSTLAFVDPKRIAVAGSSQGGIVALQLASTHTVDLFAIPQLKLRHYRAAVFRFIGWAQWPIDHLNSSISRFDCRSWDSLFRGFALDCCAGERSIYALGQL